MGGGGEKLRFGGGDAAGGSEAITGGGGADAGGGEGATTWEKASVRILAPEIVKAPKDFDIDQGYEKRY